VPFEDPKVKHSSLTAAFRLIALCAMACGMLQPAQARERGPRVEVICPTRPIPVAIGGSKVLIYELHITDFDTTALTLKRIEVYRDNETGAPLKSYAGDALTAILTAPGAMNGGKDAATIGAAKRAIAFLWVEIGVDAKPPRSLRHRLVFSAGDAGQESTLEGLQVPVRDETIPELAPPFGGGVWVAGAGPGNDSDHRRSLTAIDGHVYLAQRFAIDWVKVGANGDTSHDGAARNENFWGYGEPIHAAADGEVTALLDGIRDNTPRVLPKPVTLDNIAGNYVTVRIAPNRYVTYAHLQPGSFKVRLHDHVKRGAVLALLGNTGQATGPHLHMQLTDVNSVLESEGVPFVFARFTDLGPGSAYETDKHVSIPRSHSLPGQDAVIEFPGLKK